jgi:pimeloyl-ACP methyl ester carboxylesterase
MPEVPGVRHEYAQVNGLRIHYAEAGEGEPVILQHGWPQHWWAWRGQIPALAERYRVICPDLRGFGWSDAPPSGYEKQQLADDLIGLLDVLGLEQVRYAGHDWGGFIAFLAGFDHPDRFSHLAPVGIAPPWRTGRPPPSLALFLTYQSVLSTPVVGRVAMKRGLGKAMLKAGRARSSGEFTDEELGTYQRVFEQDEYANASVQLYRTFLTKELPALIRGAYNDRRLTTRTMLVMGRSDLLVKGIDRDALHERADDLRFEMIGGSGHWVLDERPAELTELLLDFFAS